MSIVTFLEQIATTPHQNKNIDALLKNQPPEVQKAFQNNEPELLKDFFNMESNLANRTTIFDM